MSKAFIFWFTGLSGSGKTTIAKGVKPLLEKEKYSVLILDGDHVRDNLHKHLGFTEKDIKENNELIAQLCKQYSEDYDVILVPVISPYKDSRDSARRLISNKFYEIYLSAGVDIVEKRDTKGLYAKARNKEIDNLIGYSEGSVYHAPQEPDFIVDSGKEDVKDSISKFFDFVISKVK